MKFLPRPRVGMLLAVVFVAILFAASATLFAQHGSPGNPPSPGAVLDARQIVALSIAATEHSWQARDHYTYTERDENQGLDPTGKVISETVDVTSKSLVNGARFDQLVERNGQSPSAAELKKNDDQLEKLKRETPSEKSARLAKMEDNRSFLRDLLDAFDFHLIGEEVVNGRPAFVLQATPHPGYHPHGKYAAVFSNVQGKLWVDKQDFGWVKVDGEVMQSFSLGLFVARMQRGSQVILDQTSAGDAIWLPVRLEARASARILFVKSIDMNRILTYSDYRPPADGPFSVSR
jgi:hypothetical protein